MNRAQQVIMLSEAAQKIFKVAETISGIWDKEASMKPRIYRVMPLSWFWAGSVTKDQLDKNRDDDEAPETPDRTAPEGISKASAFIRGDVMSGGGFGDFGGGM